MLCSFVRIKLVRPEWIYFSLSSFQFFLPFSTLSIGLSSCTGDGIMITGVTKTHHNRLFMFQGRCTGEKLDLLNPKQQMLNLLISEQYSNNPFMREK